MDMLKAILVFDIKTRGQTGKALATTGLLTMYEFHGRIV